MSMATTTRRKGQSRRMTENKRKQMEPDNMRDAMGVRLPACLPLCVGTYVHMREEY